MTLYLVIQAGYIHHVAATRLAAMEYAALRCRAGTIVERRGVHHRWTDAAWWAAWERANAYALEDTRR